MISRDKEKGCIFNLKSVTLHLHFPFDKMNNCRQTKMLKSIDNKSPGLTLYL